jgi:excisionase family DNA binding protein
VRCSLRPSPPTQNSVLRTGDVAQYALPYPAEAPNSTAECEAHEGLPLRTMHSGGTTPVLRVSSVQKRQVPKRNSEERNRKPPAKAKVPTQAKLLVRREEAAEFLSISVRSVDYLVATKRLSTRRIGTRVLIPMEEVRKFARSDHPERVAG